jgi:predicted ATP-binding protein involved in virulence
MQIIHLHIKNFKGFENKPFKFKERFTVAIGNNGLGKSTLLSALEVGLGAFLQSMPTLPANYIYRRQFKKEERFLKYYSERKDYLPNKENPSLRIEARLNFDSNLGDEIPNLLIWERHYLPSNSTTHNKSHSEGIIRYANFLFENHANISNVLYPVLANFHINRTNAQVRKVDKKWRRMSRLEKGYYTALGESVDFTGVYEWLYSYEKKVRDEVEFEGTIQAMYNAIKTAIPYIKEIEYNSMYNEFEVLVDFNDGQPVERKIVSMLSDGMKAMLNMVAEIAYRCIMLNGKLGLNAVTKSPGVVLIDELDMHLHPTWQCHVIKDLKDAFSSMQFVVTTHSPFIVQSLTKDELIIMEDNIDSESDPFRRSIEEILSTEMGVEGVQRSKLFMEMEKVATDYFNLIAKGKSSLNSSEVAVLRERLNQLEDYFSEDPAFVALLKSERKATSL